MKRIFLLRHAQAESSHTGSDKDRALTPQGQADATALGHAMKRKNLVPNLILCSAAKRTQQTCEFLKQSAEFTPKNLIMPELYDARRGDLFAAIQGTGDEIETLMLIGHNPAIYELAVMLASGGPEPLIGDLSEGYAPATLSVFEVPASPWAEIDPKDCKITNLLRASDYNPPERAVRWT
jgi:phosphohistidine phosphatase